MAKAKRDNYFRCQYQKGNICVSEVLKSKEKISTPEILLTLCKLAVKVQNEVDPKVGSRVALEVLKIHEDFIQSIQYLKVGTGASKSHYLDLSSKDKTDRTERVDLEFYGEYGLDKKEHCLSRYIKLYRKMKGWF